jgi:hypothetical protein
MILDMLAQCDHENIGHELYEYHARKPHLD